jgi:hypothetical protein
MHDSILSSLNTNRNNQYVQGLPHPFEEQIFGTYVAFNHHEMMEKIKYFDKLKVQLNLNLDIITRDTKLKSDDSKNDIRSILKD